MSHEKSSSQTITTKNPKPIQANGPHMPANYHSKKSFQFSKGALCNRGRTPKQSGLSSHSGLNLHALTRGENIITSHNIITNTERNSAALVNNPSCRPLQTMRSIV
ncbi:hypothetical protein Dimus_027468 [Dionaea muscipula]